MIIFLFLFSQSVSYRYGGFKNNVDIVPGIPHVSYVASFVLGAVEVLTDRNRMPLRHRVVSLFVVVLFIGFVSSVSCQSAARCGFASSQHNPAIFQAQSVRIVSVPRIWLPETLGQTEKTPSL